MAERSTRVERVDSEAAKLRKRHGFSYDDPLDPFDLANSLGIEVIVLNNISGISEQDLKIIHSLGADWSGLSFYLPDDHLLVILNPFHTKQRNNITLMEEICHSIYHHKPKTKVRLAGYQEIFLNFTQKDEDEAYWIGAAVLVPFKALKTLVKKRKTKEELASYFDVSPELIEFRLKVTKLLELFKAMQKVNELLSS